MSWAGLSWLRSSDGVREMVAESGGWSCLCMVHPLDEGRRAVG